MASIQLESTCRELDVMYCDEAIAVVNKGTNLLSVPGMEPSTDCAPVSKRKRKRVSEYWRDTLLERSLEPVLAVGDVSCVPRSRDKFLTFARRRGYDGAALWEDLDREARHREAQDHGEEDARCALGLARRMISDDRLRIVHRLDFETSGVLCFARTRESAAILSAAFRDRTVVKTYLALVRGRLQGEGTWNGSIGRDVDSTQRPRYKVDESGKPALTEWKAISHQADVTRLQLRPKTGRSHQLRVHCATAGHPILGDPLYGDVADRMYLHAASLKLEHPTTKRSITFAAPVPF